MSFNNGLLREYRKNQKLSNAEFANRLNVSPSHLYHLEDGSRTPSFETLEIIGKVTNLPINMFFSCDGPIEHIPPDLLNALDLKKKLDRERISHKNSDERAVEAEKLVEHVTFMYQLQSQYAAVLRKETQRCRRLEKIEDMVIRAMQEDEFHFAEIQTVI